MKPFFLILNPGARNGRSKKNFPAVHQFFAQHELSYDYVETKSMGDAQKAATEACLDEYKTVVAVGGDGTINRVLNGMYKDGMPISNARMGIVYCGTSPDFCKSYDIPIELGESLEVLRRGHHNEIRPGCIRYAKETVPSYFQKTTDNSHHFTSAVFGCCANIGIGADLADAANSGIRGVLGDWGGTFLSLLKTLTAYTPKQIWLDVDGSTKTIESLHNLSIGKTFHIASGIKIKNNLSVLDEKFYIVAIKDLSLRYVPLCLRSIYGGKELPNSPIFDFDYGKRIEIKGDNGTCRVEFDGDPAGYLPCTVQPTLQGIHLITRQCHV